MKKIIITGATGMVGRIVLKAVLDSPETSRVISFVRRPTGMENSKLQEIVISDFMDYSQHEQLFEGIDAAYFCIGVYSGQVSKDVFREVTVDYPIAFTDMLKKYSPKAVICLLSGTGADSAEKSRIAFARYKGMAENHMLKTLENVYIFRPGYIYPVQKRKEPNFGYRLSRTLYPLIRLFGKNVSIRSTELGKAMFIAGMKGEGKTVFENADILKFISSH